ncbi:MAG: HNH endonuclease [Alphaproteobacteria bacterium]
MTFGVFIHRADSIYDYSPAERYQFPRQYRDRVQACIGDWIIYLEPSNVPQTRGYFAIARVQQVVPDPSAPNMFLARIEPGSYLDFANPVPFHDAAGPVERGLLNEQGKITGRARSAVRAISAADFDRIIELGLADRDPLLPRVEIPAPADGLSEARAEYLFEQSRSRVQQLTSRIVRDRVFRQVVLRAYGERCAFTGLNLINGRGRAEVEAAHIRPVEADGPDIVNNGLALSGTAHWMFDRGLISLGDDLEILISRQVNDMSGVNGFINASRRAHAPHRAGDRPHPRFLQWHRENRFKA